MSGGGSAIRSLYDLLLFWAIAMFSALVGTPIRCPPLLLYLVLGALVGNLGVTEQSESIEFFAEWAITIVFFSLGLEETVDHFIDGIRKAWGIALIGALVPFGCGYLSAVIFFSDQAWYVHLTLATAVTATAVSLTMMVLQSIGLLKSNAAIGIMTSAVLDDVGCLILVSILIPIVVQAKEAAENTGVITNTNTTINGTLSLTGSSFLAMQANSTAWTGLQTALKSDLVATSGIDSSLLDISSIGMVSFAGASAAELVLKYYAQGNAATDKVAEASFSNLNASTTTWLPSTVAWYTDFDNSAAALEVEGFTLDVVPPPAPPAEPDGISALGILWIIGKVIIFFIVIAFLHKVVLPNDVTKGVIGKIPFVRTYGMKHLLSACNGTQVPLIIVTFGLGLGMLGAVLGFHPAIGAYFAGLILEESYFDLDPPEKDSDDEENEPFEEEPETVNTMHTAEEAVGSAAFMWLGPVFFVNLGANLEIDGSLLATAIPQALGIMAILWVGQFISASLSARFVPGGFSWPESIVIGFGMLGRAELYFVVLNEAKRQGVLEPKVFFPMAVAALFMNISLPISMSVYAPFYRKAHKDEPPVAEPSITVDEEEGPKRPSVIARRGVGIGGVEFDTAPGHSGIIQRPASRIVSRLAQRNLSKLSNDGASRNGSSVTRRNRRRSGDGGTFTGGIFEPAPYPYEEMGQQNGSS